MRLTISLALLALALTGAPALAQKDVRDVPPSHSVEQADATLARVARERAAVTAEFAASERVCYTRFFVNHCLDKAKETRRAALAGLRSQEVEANHFKRADSVAKRDQELAERVRKDNEDQALRAQQPPKTPVVEKPAPAVPTGPRLAQRAAENAAKLQKQQAEEAANAPKRAANAAAFEKRQAESVRRQADVVKKQEESAKKQALKAESERKQAAKEAADRQKAVEAAAKK